MIFAHLYVWYADSHWVVVSHGDGARFSWVEWFGFEVIYNAKRTFVKTGVTDCEFWIWVRCLTTVCVRVCESVQKCDVSVKACSHLTFAFASTSMVALNLSIVLMLTQTQIQRMGLNLLAILCISVCTTIESMQNLTETLTLKPKYEQTFRWRLN